MSEHTKILATADLHGNLPEIPECDILLVAGDVCPLWNHEWYCQKSWLDTNFRNWLAETQERAGTIIGIAGNHDFVFEHRTTIDGLHLPWVYLQDESFEVNGLKIYGLPWVPNLPRWAFYADKEGLKQRYDAVPKDTDIVLSHGPPYAFGDFSVLGNLNVGCKSANDMVRRVRPLAFVNGHIHEDFGHRRFPPQHGEPVDIYNVSYVDGDYNVRAEIVEIMIDATENSPDERSTVRDPDPDSRSSSEQAA